MGFFDSIDDFLEDIPGIGDIYGVGKGAVVGGVDLGKDVFGAGKGVISGVSSGASDIFNSSIDLTKNLAGAVGKGAGGLGDFFGSSGSWAILLYGAGALIAIKVISDARKASN